MPPANPTAPRRVVLLGSTGSIGRNTLRVIENLAGRVEVVGLAAGCNSARLAEQAEQFQVSDLALFDEAAARELRRAMPHGRVHHGPAGCERLIDSVEADLLVGAVVGAAGLPATLRAIERGWTIALANKETLVAAGELVVPLARTHGVDVLPIDSEHSAIFQCLQGGRDAGTEGEKGTETPRHGGTEAGRDGGDRRRTLCAYPHVKRIVLTASGGPFRTWPAERIHEATVEEALNHPTWKMGPKITIDSATMMNKALEIIEAHWLFGLSGDQIEVIVHPQSIAHSFVEFDDHSILAQMGTPDMRTPIQYALTWPHRAAGAGEPLDWSALRQLDFEPADFDRFPALPLAYRVIEAGGTSGAVLNAANEAAVEAFLEGRCRFGRITELVAAAMDALPARPADDLQRILEADRAARDFVREQI